MLLSIIRYIKGYVWIRISGYSTERFLNACSNKGIYIWGLHPANEAYEMYISIKHFRRIKPMIKKTGTHVSIIGRFGLPFFLHQYRRRKIFFVGGALCMVLIYLFSLHIWNIDIQGNQSQTDETIVAFLEQKEVTHGMKRSQVDCARIVKDIRKQFNDIIWVSASIDGTRLVIQVKENEDALPVIGSGQEETDQPLDIVANQDCVITDIVTRNGVPQVKAGDTVTKGTVLVCGRIPVNNDAGDTIAYQYQQSDADIRGETTLPYEKDQPLTYVKKRSSNIQKEELFVRVDLFRIGFGSRTHEYEHFEVYSREKQVKLGESFYLPIFLGKRVIKPYETEETVYKESKLTQLMSAQFKRFCEDLQKKGVEIIQNDVKIYKGSEYATAKGSLSVRMPIGEVAPTEILPTPIIENDNMGETTYGNDGSNH